MKKLIVPIFAILIISLTALNLNSITDKIILLLNYSHTPNLKTNSLYAHPDYQFVKNTKDYTPYGKQDLLNIFYTVLNNGVDTFTFYCPDEYEECINDVDAIIVFITSEICKVFKFIIPQVISKIPQIKALKMLKSVS